MIRTRQLTLLLGDIVLYALALTATLYIRYGQNLPKELSDHAWPFALLFIWWAIMFYINDLYELEFSRNWILVIRKIVTVCVIATLGSALIFYFFGSFISLSPKTNLVLFTGIFSFLVIIFRLYAVMRNRISPLSVLILGESAEAIELEQYFSGKYRKVIRAVSPDENQFNQHTNGLQIAYIIFDEKEKDMLSAFHVILPLLREDVKIMTTSSAYEYVFKKIPVKEISSAWFLEYIHIKKMPFDYLKRLIDLCVSFILIILLSPIFLICALLVLVFEGRPIFYKQKRVGKNGKVFLLRKFRSMIRDSEKAGPQWTVANDSRITKIGKFLRASHLDELPQLINIFKGEMSFVGPRPERQHFVDDLKNKIPYFEIRHAIKPGLTGWAQIRHGYTSDTEAFFEKFQYDLYYIKNRSLVFDMLIMLKTARKFFAK